MPLSPAAAARKDVTSAISPMQHRHFATIAAIVKSLDGDISPDAFDRVVRRFATELAATNRNFDRSRFITACGLNKGA